MATKTRAVPTSGKRASTQVRGGEQAIRLAAASLRGAAKAGGLSVLFSRMTPDASPGWNTLTISGLPAGTRGITAWVTEWTKGNKPHAGDAWFTTNSVQLYKNGTECRVHFHLQWGTHLPAAAQVIYG